MENPYEGQNYRPYTPPVYQPEPEPESDSRLYQGNPTFATISLVMGILSILSICCFFPAVFLFSGLGILFSCLSKGERSRPWNGKAGVAICSSCLVISAALLIFLFSFFLFSAKGQRFLSDYYHLITSEDLTEEELYNFIYKYMYGEDGFGGEMPDSAYPGTEGYEDYYEYFNDGNGYDGYFPDEGEYDFYGDDLPDFYREQPDNGSNVI